MRAGIVLLIPAALCHAASYEPTAEERAQIASRLRELESRIAKLSAPDELTADVAVYAKAARWILRYPEEFFTQAYVANTLAALDRGMERADELARGESPWAKQKGRLARAYRSRVDGSIQPYGLIIPAPYDGSKPVRLDVVLHGRGNTLNEVSFLAAHDSAAPVPEGLDHIQLEVFGRANNAYRWSGETDVFEALDSVRKRYRIDERRIVLRGFSMGGAGTWHIGLHYPDRWAGIEAGAGFVETHKYARQFDLPRYQDAPLSIYDALDYARNVFDVPTVGYGGEIDPQLAASASIRDALTAAGYHFTPDGLNWRGTDLRAIFLVGPQTPHRFHPESKRISEGFLDQAAETGLREPDQIRFVTYTERYNRCFWVTAEELERQYQQASVEGEQEAGATRLKTGNVARLSIRGAGGVRLDGQEFPETGTFQKQDGRWRPAGAQGLHKVHGLQGPIDDAFLEPFLCVRPTGTPYQAKTNEYALGTLERFRKEFAKFFRGEAPVKDDRAVTDAEVEGRNLILFGDPGSNRLIARVIGKLPVRWTRESIELGGRKFPAADHLPVLIYPNPLAPKHYVVINSGHTFHEEDLRGTNALLFPRLGDYAVIHAPDGTVAMAGLFDENWAPGAR